MLAAKHFDPVVGIDIHIIQPPGPVPPVPIPHPFVGFLIDPADYVPIVGSSVQINGMHRAQAGTAGKCVPPHIPIGGVFVPPPPGNECEMFMGSATVEVDGDAQSYMSLPALSCQSIGMPSIPRISPKKKTIPKCLMLPTSQVLPIPAGPPVMIGGPPTISIMGLAMKAGMAALGKLAKAFRKLQKGSKRWKALSDKLRAAAKKAMDKLGIPPSLQNKVSRAICSVTGHPVDIATGKVFTDAIDFELPGPLPLKWERVWFSTSVYQGPLGHGWHHSYDLGLVDEVDAVVVRMADGRSVTFPRLSVGDSAFDRMERMTLNRDRDGYALRDTSGLAWRFGRVTFDSDVQALLRVENRVGDRIEFGYDRLGRLELITDSAGRKLSVNTDSSGRIQEIRAPHPDKANATISIVLYEYDEVGRLVAVRDALDQPMRFRYQGCLMVQETDRNGLSFYFEYDGTDEKARCVHTWGDGGIYNHCLEYDLVLKRTKVTDSLGQSAFYDWNDDGVVIKSLDPMAYATETLYNEFNQPISEINEFGRSTTSEYDDCGNLVLRIAPDAGVTLFQYNDMHLIVKQTNCTGGSVSYDYNQYGQITSLIDVTGLETRYIYEDSQLAIVYDPAGNATRFVYDASGNVLTITSPTGAQTRWGYDQLGRVVSITDPYGNVRRHELDLLGRIKRSTEPDGNQRELRYDATGRVVFAKDLQREVRYTYQGRGRLATRSEAGATVSFIYNTEEDFVAVRNEFGYEYRFQMDSRGDVERETAFGGVSRIYVRDAGGRVIRVERSSGIITLLRYDAGGRVVEVNHSDGTFEHYSYNENGQLIEAVNESCSVRRERDALGRIVKEFQGDDWVHSEYDRSGFRSAIRTSIGSCQLIQRDVLGNVTAMQVTDQPGREVWQARIVRDAAGTEIQRILPGNVDIHWGRDRLGRPLTHTVTSRAGYRHQLEYEWEVSDRLTGTRDSLRGAAIFEHDSVGNLAAIIADNEPGLLRMPDVTGNLFRTRERTDRNYGPAGELLESRSQQGMVTYMYDADGNLVCRNGPDGKWNYSWNASGYLTSVQSPDNSIVRFRYDPFGRRVEKASDQCLTQWVWDGDVPLVERRIPRFDKPSDRQTDTEVMAMKGNTGQPQSQIEGSAGSNSERSTSLMQFDNSRSESLLWIFEPEEFALCARVSEENAVSIICDHTGTPILANVDDQFFALGNGAGDSAVVTDRQNRLCPFRFPGQYCDIETKLFYNRFRYYDPDGGMYISQDPIGLEGGLRSYAYVPDPLVWIDPLGLKKKSCKPAHVDTKSTGRTKPRGKNESFAMDHVRKHPENGDVIIAAGDIGDRCFAGKGWNKMSQKVNGVDVHYMAKFDDAGAMTHVTDFKFK